jgi:hypothetical protein
MKQQPPPHRHISYSCSMTCPIPSALKPVWLLPFLLHHADLSRYEIPMTPPPRALQLLRYPPVPQTIQTIPCMRSPRPPRRSLCCVQNRSEWSNEGEGGGRGNGVRGMAEGLIHCTYLIPCTGVIAYYEHSGVSYSE